MKRHTSPLTMYQANKKESSQPTRPFNVANAHVFKIDHHHLLHTMHDPHIR